MHHNTRPPSGGFLISTKDGDMDVPPLDEDEKRMLLDHDQSIRELKNSMLILQRDQENLKEYVGEIKDDFKGALGESESRLQKAFDTLRADVVNAFKSARESVPLWTSAVIAALGVIVGVVGVLHGWG